jgi:aryl-alcohol dehydrogenase-like predicted oxidoreductase
MQYRPLGLTGIRVSAVAFGAGPVPALMVGDAREAQAAVVRRAIEAGVNWFDTAATYGQGQSETNLGEALRRAGVRTGVDVHVATKVRLSPEHLDRGATARAVRESLLASLRRLGLASVTLLQLHNSVTARRGDEPSSVTPYDVLRPGGIADAMGELRADGLVRHLGLTGIGRPDALREVIRSQRFETIQVPYHVLNPSAGHAMPVGFGETDYGNVIADCAAQQMGVLAIRVFAGGALAGGEPSAHTLKTPFFPLELYRRDQRRAARLAEALAARGRVGLKEAALRFVLGDPRVAAAIAGFGEPAHVDEAAAWAREGPLPEDVLDELRRAGASAVDGEEGSA